MRDQSSRPTPTSRIDLPGAAAARFVRAFIVRDTRGCNLVGDSQLNRFPASSHCLITWFLEGGIDMLSSGGQEQNIRLGRCVVGGCQTHPVTSRNRGDVHALMAIFYPDAFHRAPSAAMPAWTHIRRLAREGAEWPHARTANARRADARSRLDLSFGVS